MLELASTARLVLILLAQLVEQLGQASVRSSDHPTVRVVHLGAAVNVLAGVNIFRWFDGWRAATTPFALGGRNGGGREE